MPRTLIVLVTGPYRSGTNNDPGRMKANLRKMEDAALRLFRAGHIPFIGEWVAQPLLKVAGAKKICDPKANEILYPVAVRLIRKCDAILRLPGDSEGADGDVRIARQLNIPVYYDLEQLLRL